ncbi:MAG: hypothetical protein ACNS64_07470, partial [Candidatus Halalkalibacterium sp. M3_1C_030]
MITKRLYATFFVILLTAGSMLAQDGTEKRIPVEIGKEYTDSLTTGSTHIYTLEADSGRFVFGMANQQTVDVKIEVEDPSGNIVGAFDTPARGREVFQFDTESVGLYSIKVSPFEEEEGRYTFTVSVVEPVATEPSERVDQLMMSYSGNEVPG